MTRDPRYDCLFEPLQIGPVTAKNRFYQVPHCNGMGHRFPRSLAAMRGVKAEGGWAVVCTEECEIHHSSDLSPHAEGRLWDDSDIPGLALMSDAVHEQGALAGIQLAYNGFAAPNRFSREVPLAPGHVPVSSYDPLQARAMDLADIRRFRRWHRDAAVRAQRAGFDVIYVYAGHDLSLPMHFLSRRHNQRSDAYGGSLENRVRLLRELLEETKEAVGERCAVALRLAVDELLGEGGLTSDGEGREVVEMLAELPDLWDVNVSDWSNDSQTSRFAEEGYQENHVAFVKSLTSKPVVGVGRFTSPDAMVSQLRRGVLDFIGAARPSIADPFLPRKIEEGRIDDIRECIGCNICVSGDITAAPIRCTQNPTMGEEWRRGWHPERIPARGSEARVLIVGAGPAGLECARALGQRGYEVTLAEAETELGGRVTRESRLPGLAAWARVRDHRLQQLSSMTNVEIYRASRLTVEDLQEFGFPQVVVATGARWRRDGVGRANPLPLAGHDSAMLFSPDDIMAGAQPLGPVVVFDDDHFYLGSVLAEKLRLAGLEVTLVTPAAEVASWTRNTLEQHRIQCRLIEIGVKIIQQVSLTAIGDGEVETACIFTGKHGKLAAGSVVPVTARLPNDELWRALQSNPEALADCGISSVTPIGDCLAPATIAHAVYAGHRFARELDAAEPDGLPYAREKSAL